MSSWEVKRSYYWLVISQVVAVSYKLKQLNSKNGFGDLPPPQIKFQLLNAQIYWSEIID